MPESKKYIPCKFSAGMFPSEYSVTIRLSEQELFLFAPKDRVLVRDRESGGGLLEVDIVDAEHNVIGLPAEVFELGRRYFEFPIEQLRSA